ncbi:MAG: hypothetical protein V1744_08195 [Candidatus Altiarchaeota archaeon]
MEVCPRCGTRELQDLRTWRYVKEICRHICPICVLQGAEFEDPNVWEKDIRVADTSAIATLFSKGAGKVNPTLNGGGGA